MAKPGRARRLTQLGLVLGCVLLCGCRWLPLQRPDPSFEPRPAASDAAPSPTPAPAPLDVTGPEPATPPSLQPVPDPAGYAADLPQSTPLLDQAYERVMAIETRAAAPQPTSMQTRGPAATAPTDRPADTDPPRVDPHVVPAAGTSEGTGTGNAASVSPPTTADVVDKKNPTPRLEPTDRTPAADPQPPSPDESWQEGLETLLGLAREQALRETELGRPGLWAAREQLLARLAAADRSLWNTVLEALAEPTPPNSGRVDSAPVQPTADASRQLHLAVASLTFCRKVEGFGNFEPLPADALKAGRPLGLYWEVEGLESEIDGPWHRTRLASALEVLDASGAVVWSSRLGQAEDACRRPRRDYFANTRITLPETLKPGPYVLRLKLDDRIAATHATAELEFAIAP